MKFTPTRISLAGILTTLLFTQISRAALPSLTCELYDPKVTPPHSLQVPGSCDQRKVCLEYVVCYNINKGRKNSVVKNGKEVAFNAICPSDNQGNCPKPTECAKANIENNLDVKFIDDKKNAVPLNAAQKLNTIINEADAPQGKVLQDTADAGSTEGVRGNAH